MRYILSLIIAVFFTAISFSQNIVVEKDTLTGYWTQTTEVYDSVTFTYNLERKDSISPLSIARQTLRNIKDAERDLKQLARASNKKEKEIKSLEREANKLPKLVEIDYGNTSITGAYDNADRLFYYGNNKSFGLRLSGNNPWIRVDGVKLDLTFYVTSEQFCTEPNTIDNSIICVYYK